MGWFDEQIRQRKTKDDEIFNASILKMASAVTGKKFENENENFFAKDENFYRQLPPHELGISDVITFMKDCIIFRDIVWVITASAAVTLLGMLTTQLTKIMTGAVLSAGNLKMLYGLVFFMSCAAGASTLISSVSFLLTNKIGTKISLCLEAAVMMRVLSLPSKFFREYSAGDLARRVQIVKPVCNLLLHIGLSIGLSALMSLLYLGQFARFASVLVFPAFIIILAMALVTAITFFLQVRQSRKIMEFSVKEAGISIALISGIQKIRLAGAEKRAFSKWAEVFAKQAQLTYNPPMFLKLNGGAAFTPATKNSAKTFMTVLIMLAGNILLYFTAAKNNIRPSDYLAFNTGFGLMFGTFNALASASILAAQIVPMFSLIEPILKATPEISEGKKILSKISGSIELNNICFRYGENMPFVINNLSLKISAGEYVAIVGPTGCGKSTLMRLLLGFEKPERGAVYYDGTDINTVDLKSLRRRVGTVTQDGGLFQGDIFSNITISAPNLTMKDAWEAAEIAGIADDIKSMPMGMRTLIQEGAGGISGGQRQRLMIARAIAARPKILMFDEATSALDNLTQKKISDALGSLKCTRIIIAHRLSTVKYCDRILVLDGGRIVEEGNFDVLMKKQGIFYGLVERQKI